MRIALIGYGGVARALAPLLHRQRHQYAFRITGIHTLRHGTAYVPKGLRGEPQFGAAAANIDEFLATAAADVAVELTTLNPSTGEPALSHIRAALERGMHVVTANKGPLAHAYADLRGLAEARGVLLRHEAAVMDGAPVFNIWRHCLPAVKVLGFTGALNSTSKIVIETMERGGSLEEGLAQARALGVTEGDGSYDVEGWDSAAKVAALANVLMDARTTPIDVAPRGITRLTTARVQEIAASGKTVRLISRARRTAAGLRLRVRAEVIDRNDVLASVPGTSNLILFHTDLMGTFGTVSIEPQLPQVAYGVFSDLVDILRASGGRAQ